MGTESNPTKITNLLLLATVMYGRPSFYSSICSSTPLYRPCLDPQNVFSIESAHLNHSFHFLQH
jgi:hypothetical protein